MADELQDSQYDGPEEENSQASTLDGFKSPEALVDRKSSPSSQAALQLLRMVNAKIAKEKAAKENEASHGCLIHGARFVSCHLIRRVSSFAQPAAAKVPPPLPKQVDIPPKQEEPRLPEGGDERAAAEAMKAEDEAKKAMEARLAFLEQERGRRGVHCRWMVDRSKSELRIYKQHLRRFSFRRQVAG